MKYRFLFVINICFFILMGGLIGAQYTETNSEDAPRDRILYDHKPLKKALENEPIQLELTILNSRPRDKVILHFREMGRLNFNSIPMGLNPEEKKYIAVIDKRYHSNEILEYYIEILPHDGARVRIPNGSDNYHRIESFSTFWQFIRPVLLVLLIASPPILVYIIGRIRKAHVKRVTLYNQKLRSRRRKLARQREKHYKEYLKKLSGVKGPIRPSSTSDEKGTNKKNTQTPSQKRKPFTTSSSKSDVSGRANQGKKTSSGFSGDDFVTTGELKKELDEILKRTDEEENALLEPPPPPKPSSSPPKTDKKIKRNPRSDAIKPPSKPTKRSSSDPSKMNEFDTTKPGIKGKKPPKKTPDTGSAKPKKSNKDKDDTDNLFDILGLDV